MAHYPDLKNKRVLVTGGASGIGQSIVESFVAQGCDVTFIDFNAEAGRALAAKQRCHFEHCDLTNTPALQTLLAGVQERHGGFDVLVNNAARDDRHAIADVTPQSFDATMAVNITHYFFVAQAVVPGMQTRGGGAIVNISSETALNGHPDLPVYAAAKGACLSLTRSQARIWGEHNIRVNAVVPGWVRTQRQIDKWITPAAEAEQMQRQALKGWIQPQDIANMVTFLSSADARMCTAEVFVVNAGTR